MILLTVDEDPAAISHTLDIISQLEGSHDFHQAGNLIEAEAIARQLDHLDILILPAIASNGEHFFPFRDAQRARFPNLKVLFLNDYDIRAYQAETGIDPVLPRFTNPQDLLNWAKFAGLIPSTESDAKTEPLLTGSPQTHQPPKVPVVKATIAKDNSGDEELPVAGLVTRPTDRLGDYQLIRIIASHDTTDTYEAVQLAIDRTVALVMLKPELSKDIEALREFRGAVRAKAAVTHPNITPVYEAHEEKGIIFYTRELVEGLNLPQLGGTGKRINQRTLIQIIRVTSECIRFMRVNGINFSDVEPRHIYLGQDAQVRINNIAALDPKNFSTPAEDIAKVAVAIRPLVSEKPTENNLILPLLSQMRAMEFPSWESLLTVAEKLEDQVKEAQTYSVSGRSALSPTGTSKKSLIIVALAALVISALASSIILLGLNKPKPIATSEMLRIPAGEFIYQENERRTIPKPFWIDKYEVTIAQYAEFLDALASGDNARFDHPDQATKALDKSNHIPDDWDVYYKAAKDGSTYDGAPIDLNCPVMLVDWWDANAYANWKGHRLPTEEEWSKAARGADGNIYPWGDQIDYKKFNSSLSQDDFDKWSPVNALPEDVSPYGVQGTCGNVSEWTASTDTHPDFFDRTVPVVRGGSFVSPPELYPLTHRRRAESAESRSVYIGFRTVSDTDPSLN